MGWHKALSLILVGPLLLGAQPAVGPGDWAAVEAVAPGARLRLNLSDGQTLQGRLVRVTPEGLVLRKGRGEMVAARPEITRAYQVGRPSMAKRVAGSMVIGAGVGVGTAAIASERTGDVPAAFAFSLAGLIGAGVGAVFGVVAGRRPGKLTLLYYVGAPEPPARADTLKAP